MHSIHCTIGLSAFLATAFITNPLDAFGAPASAAAASAAAASAAAVQESATLARDSLPADTAFVAHVDLRALFASEWWAEIDEATGLSESLTGDEDLAQMQEMWGIDPLRDILSVTVVGLGDDPEEGALVVRTTDRVDQALAKVRSMPDYGVKSFGGLELEAWSVEGEEAYGLVLGRPQSSEREIVIGQDPGRVAAVVRAMLGDAPSVATARQAKIQARPQPGSYVYVEVGSNLLGMLEGTPASSFASKARNVAVDIGEDDGRVRAQVHIGTDSAESSKSIAGAVRGARSLLELSGVLEEIPDVARDVLDTVRVDTQERSVRFEFSVAIDELMRELR